MHSSITSAKKQKKNKTLRVTLRFFSPFSLFLRYNYDRRKEVDIMKKLGLVSLIVLMMGGLFSPHSTQAATKQNAVFYVETPGQEVTSMAMGIQNHIKNGANVKVVYLTTGYTRENLQTVNDRLRFVHMQTLTKTKYIQLKKQDATRAAVALGVKKENVEFLSYDTITKDQVKNVILAQEKKTPNASHKTLSYMKNRGNSVAGQALLDLYNAKKVKDARFYVEHEAMLKALGSNQKVIGFSEAYSLSSKFKQAIQAAADEYADLNYAKNQYCLVGTEMAGPLETATLSPRSIVHVPNAK